MRDGLGKFWQRSVKFIGGTACNACGICKETIFCQTY